MKPRQVEAKHIQLFLDLLDEHRKVFLEPKPEERPQRLYFLDSDVLSNYINGRILYHHTSWANFFGLDGRNNEHSAIPEDTEDIEFLTQAIGQATTRFLFGQFNLQLNAQQKRYYLTAEHERELRSIMSSVLHEARAPKEDWQKALQDEYLKFCSTSLSPEEAQKTAESITHKLVDQSPLGMIPRAYAVDRDFTSSLSSNLIRPTLGDGVSFIFSEKDDHYLSLLEQFKSVFFDVFLRNLREHHSGTERYFPIKRKIFEMHGPRIPLRRYVEAVRTDTSLTHLGTSDELERQALIAALQANDVVSLARLAAMAKYLNDNQPFKEERHWETCLISGSLMMRDLLSALEKETDYSELVKNRVRIINPLCFLRHPELYDPEGVKALEDRSAGEHQDEEYALTQIFGRQDQGKSIDEDKSRAFTDSLARTLHGVVTREANNNDRSLKSFWATLTLNENYSPRALTENVRSYIAHRFTDTLFKLTELAPRERHTLSHVSVPTLDLRQSQATLKLLKSIRDSVGRDVKDREAHLPRSRTAGRNQNNLDSSSFPSTAFQEVLEEDNTGYSAMLCAAMGFIVRGNDWLHLAQVMASTAVMFALGARDETSYPQGNEALYLKTFISRISWNPRKNVDAYQTRNTKLDELISSWLESQLHLLRMARCALEGWKKSDHMSATEMIPGVRKTRYDLINVRYDVEALANRSFALEWEFFLSTHSLDAHSISNQSLEYRLLESLEDACVFLAEFRREYGCLKGRCGANPVEDHYYQTVAFIASQLWAVILQCWLMLCFDKSGQATTPFSADEALLSRLRVQESIISTHLPSYYNRMNGITGQVVRLTMETYAIARLGKKKGDWGLTRDCFAEVRFAAIDEFRFNFFNGCWCHASNLATPQ